MDMLFKNRSFRIPMEKHSYRSDATFPRLPPSISAVGFPNLLVLNLSSCAISTIHSAGRRELQQCLARKKVRMQKW